MSASTTQTGTCSCGQVVFDLAERTLGEILDCSWCGRKYRFNGSGQIAPLSPEETRALGKFRANPGRAARAGKLSAQADRSGPPGGVLPMIGFILAFNALAFLALWLVVPKGDDGLRHAVWNPALTISGKAFWPDAAALLCGHLTGFGAWAMFAYHVYRRERRGKSSN